jgi:glycosyltransferase involved in cell wall biosynthesis
LVQTAPVDAVVVVDDGSEDSAAVQRTVDQFGAYAKLLRQPNRGVSAARNAGWRYASSSLIVFLDSDDALLPHYVASQEAYMHRNPDAAVVYCDAELFGNGVPQGHRFMQQNPSTGLVSLAALVEQRCTVLTTVMARRPALEAVGGYDETLRSSEDFDLWLRLLNAGFCISYQTEVLARHRIRPGSLSADPVWMCENILEVLERAGRMRLSTEERAAVRIQERHFSAQLHLERSRTALAERDYSAAQRHFGEYLQLRSSARNVAIGWALKVFPGLVRKILRGKR